MQEGNDRACEFDESPGQNRGHHQKEPDFCEKITTRFPLEIVRQAERALLRIVRRMRLRDEGERVGSSLLSSPALDDLELIWSLDGLDGSKNVNPIPALPQELSTVVPPQAVLHAVERLIGSYEAEREKSRRDLDIAQNQQRDNEARLGGTFAHTAYLEELTGLRDSLEAALSSPTQACC